MKSVLPNTPQSPSLKAIAHAGPVLPYSGMYIKVNFKQLNEKPSPFKALFQTGSLVKESENWGSEWFANYE